MTASLHLITSHRICLVNIHLLPYELLVNNVAQRPQAGQPHHLTILNGGEAKSHEFTFRDKNKWEWGAFGDTCDSFENLRSVNKQSFEGYLRPFKEIVQSFGGICYFFEGIFSDQGRT